MKLFFPTARREITSSRMWRGSIIDEVSVRSVVATVLCRRSTRGRKQRCETPTERRHCSAHALHMLIVIFLTIGVAAAQESPPPATASPAPRSVRISFVPPPLEGAISLGIYDAKGKLVRVLHREADIGDFEIGNDALSTTWDGKTSTGESLPPGKYHARGFVVGELVVEGIGFFFNDWVTEDQPLHIATITALAVENGVPFLTVQLLANETATVVCDGNGNVVTTGETQMKSADCRIPALPELIDPIACASGKDGTLWIIDRIAKGSAETEVEQFAAGKELLRRLSVPAPDPAARHRRFERCRHHFPPGRKQRDAARPWFVSPGDQE